MTIPFRCLRLAAVAVSMLLVHPSLTFASDWPKWLGPNGDNIAPADGAFEPDLDRWKVAWEGKVGRGYSSVVVSQGRAYTLGHDEKSQETVVCLNAATGETIWSVSYEAQLLPKMHPGGPNASPTVIGDKVLTVSKDGQVQCLTADKGTKVWGVNLGEILVIKLPSWGYASSPVVHQGRVLLSAGKVAALDLNTGEVVWTSKKEHHPGYTTPVVFAQGGKDYVASLDGKGVAVLSAADGEEVAWSPFKAQFDMTATTPQVHTHEGDMFVFISGNLSSEMLHFDGKRLGQAWTSKEFKNGMNNSVPLGEVLYGIDGKHGGGRFVCITADDGIVKWAKEGFGFGNVIGIGGDHLLALTESGELVVIQPSVEGYREVSRRQVLGKTCWTTPVYAGGRIYVRNDRGDVLCLASSR